MGESKRREAAARFDLPPTGLSAGEALMRFSAMLERGSALGFALHIKVASTLPQGVHSEEYQFGMSPQEIATVLWETLRGIDAQKSALEDAAKAPDAG